MRRRREQLKKGGPQSSNWTRVDRLRREGAKTGKSSKAPLKLPRPGREANEPDTQAAI